MVELQEPYTWPRDTGYYYSLWSLASFVGIICINHLFYASFANNYLLSKNVHEKNRYNMRFHSPTVSSTARDSATESVALNFEYFFLPTCALI
ncbi:hypothetical protein ACTXT7_010915 [Hymenolepis weldensis]